MGIEIEEDVNIVGKKGNFLAFIWVEAGVLF